MSEDEILRSRASTCRDAFRKASPATGFPNPDRSTEVLSTSIVY
jgi:hypothetical protein